MPRLAVLTIVIFSCSVLSAQNTPKVLTQKERRGAESYNKGSELFSAGNYAQSLPLLLAADSLIGETALVDKLKLHYALGICYLKTNKPAPALQYFEWVAEKDSSYPYIYLQAAESAREAKNRDKAIKYYQKSLVKVKEEQKPIILKNISELLLQSKDFEGALNACNQAIKKSSKPNYFLLRGQIYDALAEKIDHAGEKDFNSDDAIKEGTLTEEKMLQAIELRQKALDDYTTAAEDSEIARDANKFIERSLAIIKNDQEMISEIRYLKENP